MVPGAYARQVRLAKCPLAGAHPAPFLLRLLDLECTGVSPDGKKSVYCVAETKSDVWIRTAPTFP